MAFQQNQIQNVIATALFKAWEDDSFKDKLLASPIDTIEKLTGERLTFNSTRITTKIKVAVTEDSDLIIPSYVDIYDEELSEEKLEFVAGGGQTNYNSQEEFVSFLKSYL